MLSYGYRSLLVRSRKPTIEDYVKTNKIPRQILEQAWNFCLHLIFFIKLKFISPFFTAASPQPRLLLPLLLLCFLFQSIFK
ncbi:hypothetical protein V6N12_023579 [Hibiscus sabdariffa]|uniref:Uncharacterized protein n=1 Tax=Hibiscus sabdariffa TaxID=183260 RepID=A0ABR2FY26_9ROSI